MKNVSVTMGLAALLLAGAIQARDITIKWLVSGDHLTYYYLPKVASDTLQNVAVIAEAHTGLADLEDELGSFQPLTKAQVSWTGSNYLYGPSQQIGHAPTIALAYDSVDNYDDAIEVHQGGQADEGSLWFQLGSNASPFYSAINWGDATQLAPGPSICGPIPLGCHHYKFDSGYNATVAADNDLGAAGSGDHTTATIVEVHQLESGASALYYHVGVLTLGPKPSIKWGPSLPFDSSGKTQGSVPTVSIANNVAVLVSQGSGGTLWYAIGAVDTATSTIAWTAPISYASGYNPTVSVYGDGTDLWIKGRVLVEAHQVDDTTGSLVYSAGVLKGSSPTSIVWSVTTSGSPNTNIPYAMGCYPSVALAFDGHTAPSPSEVSVTETHETECGNAYMTEYWFGYLIGK
jgi:hypothetical protein